MSARRTPVIPVSLEVVDQSARARPCAADAEEIRCPYGDAIAIVCTGCNEPVFLAVLPGTWCEHAAEMLRLGFVERVRPLPRRRWRRHRRRQ